MIFEKNKLGGWLVPDNTIIPANTVIPAYSELGNDCTLGNECELGTYCTLEGVKPIQWLTLSNVDGTGRQVLIIKHAGGVLVRAGCFLGTPEEFIEKARDEGKHTYVSIIGAVCGALTEEK